MSKRRAQILDRARSIGRGPGSSAADWTVAWLARNAVVLALAVEVAVFAVLTDRFFTLANFRVLLIQSSVIAILAVPTALLLISGYLDLAIGSIVGLSGVILGLTLVSWGLVPALVFTILVAMSVGALQGVLATRLKFPRFVVTLGFFSAIRGLALVVSGGHLTSGFGDTFRQVGRGVVPILAIPVPVAIALVVFAMGAIFLYQTRWGRHVIAIGDNPTAAHQVGIRIHDLPWALYAATGAASGIAAAILVSRLDATPPTLGVGLELEVLTAVLLGGVAFGGGRGSLLGVAAGVLFVGALGNGLLHMGVPPFWSTVSVGTALVLAGGFDAVSQRVERRRMAALVQPQTREDGADDA